VATTLVVVALFAAASISHAWVFRGQRWAAAYTAIALTFGLGVEVLGVNTGFPFSPYEYTDVLNPQLLGVPVVVPLAWTMMAYPALLVGRRLAGAGRFGRLGVIVVGAYALASWDVFLDPQMVAENYWVWLSDSPGLPGIPDIPMVNYAGWLLVSLVLMTALSMLPEVTADEGVPAVLYGWTWLGGIVANAVFLGRPAVALWGGVLMGVVAVPYLWRVIGEYRSPRGAAHDASARNAPNGTGPQPPHSYNRDGVA
jgi:putative membrane protein